MGLNREEEYSLQASFILWHVNPSTLFNAKSCLYLYINNIWFVKKYFPGNNLCLHSDMVASIAI